MPILDNLLVNFANQPSIPEAEKAMVTKSADNIKESISQNPLMMAYQRMSMEAGLRRPTGTTFTTLRRMSRVNWVDSTCIKTLTDEVVSLPWKIVPIDTKKPYNTNLQKFLVLLLTHPNQNKETWRMWMDKVIEDIMVCDSGTSEKVRDQKGRISELYYVDGTCYSDDTEVLTKEGWKLFKDVDVLKDLFATRNQVTHEFEWQKATYKHIKEWNGDFYHFKSKSLDLMVSPNHRILYTATPEESDKEQIKTAEEVARMSKNIALPATSNWKGKEIESFTFEAHASRQKSVTLTGDQFCAFMGAYLSEGSVNTYEDQTVAISQKTYSKGYYEYRILLRDIFGKEPAYVSNDQWQLYKKSIFNYLKQFGKCYDKFIPELIMEATPRQIDIFLHYYILGDGWIDGKVSGIVTTSRKMADQLQELIQKTGYSSSVAKRTPSDSVIRGRLIKKENCRPVFVLRIRSSKYQRFNKNKISYKGKIYCVSVPNEILYVRRNGKPVWSGNTIKPCYDIKGMLGSPVAYEQYLPTPTNQLAVASWNKWDFIRMEWNPSGAIDTYGWGSSPVEKGLAVATAFLNAEAYNMSFFQRNTIPPVIINLGEDVPENEVASFRAYLAAEMAGQNGFWQPFAMAGGKGFDIKQLLKTPADMAFQEYVEWQMKWKVALYRMSPQDIGFNLDQYKVEGDVQLQLSKNKAINSLKGMIEGYINNEIINDPGWGIDYFSINLKFQWIDADTVDPVDQANIDKTYWSMGVTTSNYLRNERFGLDPIVGGKVPFVIQGQNAFALNPKIINEASGQKLVEEGDPESDKSEADEEESMMSDLSSALTSDTSKILSQVENNSKIIQKVFSPQEGLITDLSMNTASIAWMDDRGVTQPFFVTDFSKSYGFTVKPDFLDQRRNQELFEGKIAQIVRKLKGNTPEVKIMSYEEVEQMIPTNLYNDFTNWINVKAPYNSMEFRQRWGGSRKSDNYIVNGFITGKDLHNKELQVSMKANPDMYKNALRDFARLWLIEKRFYLGDRKLGHYIVTSNGNGFGMDYQFLNTKSSWEKTSKWLPQGLKEINPELYNMWVKYLVAEYQELENVEKAFRIKERHWQKQGDVQDLSRKMGNKVQRKILNWYNRSVHINNIQPSESIKNIQDLNNVQEIEK